MNAVKDALYHSWNGCYWYMSSRRGLKDGNSMNDTMMQARVFEILRRGSDHHAKRPRYTLWARGTHGLIT